MSEPQEAGQRTLTARGGSQRSTVLRAIYTWFNLTLLLIFGWPALIFFTDAPASQPRYMPNDWFIARLLITVLVLILVIRFWRSSGISGRVARFDNAMALFEGTWLRQQVPLFLLGTTVILVGLLLSSAFVPALRILTLGLAEALAAQALIAGYVKGILDELNMGSWKSFLIATGLFVATFALRSTVATGTQSGTGMELVLTALIAGAVLGIIVGVVSLTLRDRLDSLLPGILAHWLFLGIIPPFIEG